jgi:hypothetical protein
MQGCKKLTTTSTLQSHYLLIQINFLGHLMTADNKNDLQQPVLQYYKQKQYY